jgi:hypothetical protein
MTVHRVFAAFAIMSVASSSGLTTALAGQAQSPPTPAGKAQPLPKDVPFAASRGLFPPLYFSIDGLFSGAARVGAGTRQFGVCWQGGAPPYEVKLTGPNGDMLFDKTGIAVTQFLFEPGKIELSPGAYVLTVIDDTTFSRSEHFTVVPRFAIPADMSGSADPLKQATVLAGMNNQSYDLEAYLLVAPTLAAHSAVARTLVDELCHVSS